MRTRIVLLGGTELTLAIAERIADHLVGVVWIPSTMRISYSPGGLPNARFADVGDWAEARAIATLQWSGIESLAAFLDGIESDWGLAAGWYYLLPKRILDRFPHGCGGVHASLLPRYRGNAPLNWAILNGEAETGVSLFQMTPGLDDGPLYGQERIPIGRRTSVADLLEPMRAATLRLVSAAVADLDLGKSALFPQTGEPCYGLARLPADGRIGWSDTAEGVDRLVRATTRPYPGAFTHLDGERITIWRGAPVASAQVFGSHGQIWRLDGRVVVVTGAGLYGIEEATLESGDDALPSLTRSAHRRLA
ncbi:MAG: methionyl-tRNA formyltransferase [Acidimicrobiia bacterium]|nr:methionyl-tRNA formyltransferase [Acidimicrobiia bacterium]